MLEDVSRLERLVEDLLALARLDEQGTARRLEPVLLDSLVDAVAAGYPHARLPVRIAESEPTELVGDPDALRRVVVNLVDNALRYASTEVTISVRTARDGKRRAVVLEVADDGPGIPDSERERVFDRFYRVEASRSRQSGGNGLGLPIVRDLVRAHGGTITLQARADGRSGLVAAVVLPVRPAGPLNLAAQERAVAGRQAGRRRPGRRRTGAGRRRHADRRRGRRRRAGRRRRHVLVDRQRDRRRRRVRVARRRVDLGDLPVLVRVRALLDRLRW